MCNIHSKKTRLFCLHLDPRWNRGIDHFCFLCKWTRNMQVIVFMQIRHQARFWHRQDFGNQARFLAIWQVFATNRENANNPLHHHDEHPPRTSQGHIAPPSSLPPNMNQNNGSTTPISVNRTQHVSFSHDSGAWAWSVWDWNKSSLTDNLLANTTPTRMTLP